jgi:E3 ubiquitin-protein ligase Mdm2
MEAIDMDHVEASSAVMQQQVEELGELPDLSVGQLKVQKARARAEACREVGEAALPPSPPQQGCGDGAVDACTVCRRAGKDATIVHTLSGTGHICCCFDCAERLQAAGHGCPMCAGSIDMVIKQVSN